MTHSYDLTQGSIAKSMLHLTTPLIIGNILQQLYNTVDAFMIGRYSGNLEFAAVGVASALMNLFLFMITGACTGISVLLAHFYGAMDLPAFRRQHWLSLVFGLVVSLGLSGLALFFLTPLLKLMQTPPELISYVQAYLTIILLSLPASFLYNLYGALLRAIGQAGAALLALACAVSLNLLLDYLFIAILHWGIVGAAWATAASQALSALLCLLYLRQKAAFLFFRRSDCQLDKALLKKTAHFCFVTALHQSSLYIGKLFVQGAVNSTGTDMISAYTATTRLEGFANSFADSGSAATSVLVAQNLGAKKLQRVKESFRCSLLLMIVLGLVMSALMYIGRGPAVALMLGSSEGLAYTNACEYMKLIALFYVFCFTGNTFAGYFEGSGRVSVPLIGAIAHISLRVVLSWLFVAKLGLPAVALATGLGWILINLFWNIIKVRSTKKGA